MKTQLVQRFWWVTLAAACGVMLTASLGLWQVRRAEEKRAVMAAQAAQAQLQPASWDEVYAAQASGRLAEMFGRRLRLQGRWVSEATVFLDNRPMRGRAGFIVVTPLVPQAGGAGLLVQRGWLPRRTDDRSALPHVHTPTEVVTIEGKLAPPPSQLLQLGADTAGPIRQNIYWQDFAAEWRLSLLPASVQQSAPPETAADGTPLEREWTVVAVDPAKHIGYAVQWFGLAAVIFALYVWFQFISPSRRAR